MPKTKAVYSDKDKAAALTLLDFNKGNVNKSATALSIPESTLRKWEKERVAAKPAVIEPVEEFQGELSERFERSIRIALSRADDLLTVADLSDVRLYVEMMTDKLQLLNNRPTAIQGVVTEESKNETVLMILGKAAARREKTINQKSE